MSFFHRWSRFSSMEQDRNKTPKDSTKLQTNCKNRVTVTFAKERSHKTRLKLWERWWNLKTNKLGYDYTNFVYFCDGIWLRIPVMNLESSNLCIIDGTAYTNTQLKPKTGPDQMFTYYSTKSSSFFFFRGLQFFLGDSVASSVCQSARRDSWVGCKRS